MRSLSKFLILVSIFSTLSLFSYSQFNGTNLMEYQYGKVPGDTNAISTLYDRTVFNYNYKDIKAGLALEQFYTRYDNRNYIKPTQYYLQYSKDFMDIKAGNFYETIGRGLLLRSFEIPGAILEDLSYRSRSYFQRDVIGVSTRLRYKDLSVKLLYGKPLNNVFPPSQPDSLRRTDKIAAVAPEYTFAKQTLGASLLNLKNSNKSTLYGMFTSSGIISQYFSYYSELAKDLSNYSLSDFSDKAAYAMYASINLSINNLGVSAEYKSYKNFSLGAGINEPPALVKEHSYKVLNRSTHVLQPINESGYQIEAFYTFADLSTLTLNNTIAVNNLNDKFVFQEYFAEYDFSIKDNLDAKIFADYAEDPFKLEMNRISTGAYLKLGIPDGSSIKTDYEFQTFHRSGDKVFNHVLSLGYNHKSKLLFNITGEISNDPFLVEEEVKTWIGTNIKYQINSKHSLLLFAGQRRGGPACNAGVCYEVLDFNGIEVRITSRF